jgi:hypothetical protein
MAPLILNIGMSGQLHALAALPSVRISKWAEWTPELVWTFWRREKNFLPQAEVEPQILQNAELSLIKSNPYRCLKSTKCS